MPPLSAYTQTSVAFFWNVRSGNAITKGLPLSLNGVGQAGIRTWICSRVRFWNDWAGTKTVIGGAQKRMASSDEGLPEPHVSGLGNKQAHPFKVDNLCNINGYRRSCVDKRPNAILIFVHRRISLDVPHFLPACLAVQARGHQDEPVEHTNAFPMYPGCQTLPSMGTGVPPFSAESGVP